MTDEQFRKEARVRYSNNVLVRPYARVSEHAEGEGAYVEAFVWVPASEEGANSDKETVSEKA